MPSWILDLSVVMVTYFSAKNTGSKTNQPIRGENYSASQSVAVGYVLTEQMERINLLES